MSYVFLYRIADSDDRDCCAYIESTYHTDILDEVIIHGANYSGRFGQTVTYEEVETFLNKKDFETIMGKGITEKDYNRIVKKLTSDKAKEFQEKIIESEMEYLKDTYNLDDNDIEKIFDTYYLDYKDRGCVGYVYDDLENFGEEEMWSLGYDKDIPNFLKDCIDYEKAGEALMSESELLLDDGRVVQLCY